MGADLVGGGSADDGEIAGFKFEHVGAALAG